MGRRVFADNRRHLRERCRAARVDRNHSERRVESSRGVHGDAVETDEMRRPHDHGEVEGTAGQQPVGVRSDRPRVHQARVGHNQRDEPALHVACGVSHVRINGSREARSRSGIPRACDRGRPDHFPAPNL